MKALTLTQPWATLIALGIKRIENRTWHANNMVGQRFAIHASRELDVPTLHGLQAAGWLAGWLDSQFPTSRIVAVATYRKHVTTIEGVERELGYVQTDWWLGPKAFVLDDIRQVSLDIEVKGKQGFWVLDREIENLVETSV